MYRVDVYLRVRRAVMVDGMSMREAARTFGLHRAPCEWSVPVPGGSLRRGHGHREAPACDGARLQRPWWLERSRSQEERHTVAASSADEARFRRRIHHGQGLRPESIAVRPGRCSFRCPIRRDRPSATSARPWPSHRRRGAQGPLLRHRPCPTGRMLRKAYGRTAGLGPDT